MTHKILVHANKMSKNVLNIFRRMRMTYSVMRENFLRNFTEPCPVISSASEPSSHSTQHSTIIAIPRDNSHSNSLLKFSCPQTPIRMGAASGSGSGGAVDNLSCVLYAKGDLRMEQRPIPEPKDDEVRLRMACVGICGSDVHYWQNGRIGHFIVTSPMIMGHEAAGIVHKCGKNVKNLKPGDRVAIEPQIPCRRCADCKRGEYNLCKDVYFCATPPDHGNLSRFFCHAADFCFKLPDHVSLEEGALLEPISVAVQACKKGNVTLGSKVLITGAGPIGLANLLVSKAMGASEVIMTDVVENRLATAKKHGADFTVHVGTSTTAEDLAIEIEKTLGSQPDISIDCCGVESTISTCMLATRSGGVMCLVGLGPPEAKVPIIKSCIRELNIRGVFRYANCYPMALAMISSGKVDAKRLITHNYTLEQSLDAFENARSGAGGAIKVMIHC